MTDRQRELKSDTVTRDFTVAVFVVHDNRVLLHYHAKLRRWLPPGGHIEPHELPDDAAVREVWEETGVTARLTCQPRITFALPEHPRQLCPPFGMQLEDISPGHQHIDLIYFATGEPAEPRQDVGWFNEQEWQPLALTEEVAAWCRAALRHHAENSPTRDHC